MKRPDHHNEIELNLLQEGAVTYLLAGSKVRIRAGQLAAFWASIPHQIIDLDPLTEYQVVTIPFPEFMLFKLPEPFVQTLLRGSLVFEKLDEQLAFEIQRFRGWETDLALGNPEIRNLVLLEIQARMHRMALAIPKSQLVQQDVPPGVLHEGSLNKVEQIACTIAQRYLEPLTAEIIGKAVGLHPNYAMNLFKKTFGTTLIDYLIHHRISHAQRLLVTSDDKILDVALASGFNTLSRFNQAFRRKCGCSPREYRLRNRGHSE